MTSIPRLPRRAVLAAPALIAGCALTPSKPGAAEADLEGREVYSESVQCAFTARDGALRFKARLGLFPEVGVGWIWAHARTPRGFFSHIDHSGRVARAPTPVDAAEVHYADRDGRLSFARIGDRAFPAAATVRAEIPAWRAHVARPGPGPERLSATMQFRPQRRYAGVLPGRTEVFGEGSLELRMGGETFTAEGLMQFHEQQQSSPRFVTPFSYASLWADDASITLIQFPEGGGGYLLSGARTMEAKSWTISAPGPRRELSIALDTAETLSGVITRVENYAHEIFAKPWRGSMVDAELGGRRFVGLVNDFAPSALRYR